MTAPGPPFITAVRAAGYRCLRGVEIPLGALSVFVGPAGAGTSTIFDVLAFLAEVSRGDLASALARRGGADRVRFRGETPGPWVQVGVEVAASDGSAVDYELRLRAATSGAVVREETITAAAPGGPARQVTTRGGDLQVSAGGLVERRLALTGGALALNTVAHLGDGPGGRQVRALAAVLASVRVVDLDAAGAARATDTGADARRLGDDGANLGAHLVYLAGAHPETFAAVEADARRFIPSLEAITLRPTTTGQGQVIQLVERGLRGGIDFGHASPGAIRVIALLALLHDPDPAKVTCLEGIDRDVSSEATDRLAELLREAATGTQLLIASHSPALVGRLRAGELVVCERSADAGAVIPAISAEDVAAMEASLGGELTLGELWFTGALGGVPHQ